MKATMNLIAAGVISSVLSALVSVAPAHAEPVKVGVIGVAEQVVSARAEDGSVRTLKQGDTVFLNEQIVTDGVGKAQVMFLDKSTLMINPGSEVVIDTFVYNPGATTGDLTIKNAKGALRFIGGVLSKEKPVTIETPVATIGIRGGIVDTHVGENGATDAIFLFGEEMTMENQSGERVSVTEVGKGLSMVSADSMPVPMPKAKIRKRLGSFPTIGSSDEGGEGEEGVDGASGDEFSEEGSEGDLLGEEEGEALALEESAESVLVEGESDALADSVTNVTQDQTRDDGGTTILANPPTATEDGFYVVKNNSFSAPVSAGHIGVAEVSGRFAGFFTEDYPTNSGKKLGVSLPANLATGFNNLSSGVLIGGDVYVGNAYATANDAFYYYYLKQASGPQEISLGFGNLIAQSSYSSIAAASVTASNAAGTHDISFYDFLPSLSAYQAAGFSHGFFDYNIADSRLLPAGSFVPGEHFGMAVDWNNNRFLTAFILWENGTTNAALTVRRDMMLAFGQVDTASQSIFKGHVFEFMREYQSATFEENAFDYGYLESFDGIYAADNSSPVEALIIDGLIANDQRTELANPFTTNSIQGQYIVQAIVTGDGTADTRTATASRTTQTREGFVAGFVVTDIRQAAGSRDNLMYWNNDKINFTLTKNPGTNKVAATIKVFDPTATGQTIDAFFGNDAGVSNIEDAYLADDLYAAQQGKVIYDSAGSPNTRLGIDAERGAIVSGDLVANVSQHCSNCNYTEWGVWAAEIERGDVGGNDVSDVVAMIPYVAGEITNNLSTNVVPLALGAVTYNGAMYGSVLGPVGQLERHAGTFSAGVNLNTRTFTDFDANFENFHFGFTGGATIFPSAGAAQVSGVAIQNLGAGGAGLVTGTINGALFGPQAQEIGGNFAVTNSVTGAEAAGVYLGNR